MYLCYVDESGTPEVPGTTSHFVLAGLAVPIWKWRICEDKINRIKAKYGLEDAEIHTGWLIRNYTEQNKISDFESLPPAQRRSEVDRYRRAEILKLQRSTGQNKLLKQTKKNYEQTKHYVHLTFAERRAFVLEVAKEIGSWGFARLFAECIDKIFFDPVRAPMPVDEQTLEQLVSRFEQYLASSGGADGNYGLLIHDNNQTIAKRHTELMKNFHRKGTFWTRINKIIETPLFVDSTLTSMIQIADVCAYSIRRYLEYNEEELFTEIFQRAHKKGRIVVGVRHFTTPACTCLICQGHRNSGGVTAIMV